MRRVTGQKLKPIIIVWCCLYVVLINCDENPVPIKDGTVQSEENSKSGDKSVASEIQSQSSNDAKFPKQGSAQLNAQKKPIVTQEDSKNSLSSIEHSETEPIAAKNATKTTKSKANSPAAINSTSISTTPKTPSIGTVPQPINAGALQRGFFVFLGLSLIVIAYIIFRCARLSRNRTQMVRKYGILAHRQDVEMRPLPLDDEDEDDTTVFDASEVGVHQKRHEST